MGKAKGKSKTRWRPSDESDALVFAVCDRFLGQLGTHFSPEKDESNERDRRGAAAAIAAWLREEHGRPDLTREKVYPLFWEAARRGFLFLRPPREKQLAAEIVEKFRLDGTVDGDAPVHVVDVTGSNATRDVTSAAADLVVSLVERVDRANHAQRRPDEPRRPVHVGMGAGLATMMVAQRFAQRIHSDADCPALVLHALSAGGFLVNDPQKAPSTCFSYFDGTLKKTDFVGLFSETVVRNQDYEKVKQNPGVRRSFERKSEIDIVVTSLAQADHEHGLLVNFLNHLVEESLLDAEVIGRMRNAGWQGDVQFRPYTSTGPLEQECPIRAVTLFELSELVEMAKSPGQYVVLVAGPCGECGASKHRALLPLVANPKLKLWTHLVTDARTAGELLRRE